ncbi:MAG: lipopolysaccharide biosynthesis protein, partial [Phycisphaerae bacterium]
MPSSDSDNSPADSTRRFLDTRHLQTDIRRRSVRGGAATLLAQFLKHFVIGLAATAILARLLSPEDFGLLAMVAAFTNFLARFQDLGLSMATVQRRDISHAQVSNLFWINLALGLLAAGLTAAFAPLVAWFYGQPELTTVTAALGAAFIFGGLTVQHRALLRRQMRFTALAGVQLTAAIGGALAGIASARMGAGYWALVVMQLVSAVLTALGVWIACGWRPGWPSRDTGVRSMLAFGGNLTAANLLNYLVRNLDNVLIGWRWGADALGLYANAYKLLLLPIRQFNTPLTNVAIPALSRLQDKPDQYRAFFKKGIQLLTTVGMPMVAFLAVDADNVILLVLGDKWGGAAPIFRLLAPAAFLGTFNVATGWVYVSTGQVDRQLRWVVFSSPVIILAFIVGLPFGPTGVAASLSL